MQGPGCFGAIVVPRGFWRPQSRLLYTSGFIHHHQILFAFSAIKFHHSTLLVVMSSQQNGDHQADRTKKRASEGDSPPFIKTNSWLGSKTSSSDCRVQVPAACVNRPEFPFSGERYSKRIIEGAALGASCSAVGIYAMFEMWVTPVEQRWRRQSTRALEAHLGRLGLKAHLTSVQLQLKNL